MSVIINDQPQRICSFCKRMMTSCRDVSYGLDANFVTWSCQCGFKFAIKVVNQIDKENEDDSSERFRLLEVY